MRVLLLSPEQRNVYGRLKPPYPSLGLLQLGACLKKDHDVKFRDVALYPRELESTLVKMKPDLVCITSVTPTYPRALELAALTRSVCDSQVVMGGPHVSILPQDPLKTGLVDFVVVGEGEVTLTELTESLIGGDPSSVKGLWMLRGGQPHATGRREPREDLDSLPFPDWSLIKRPEAYVPPEALTGKVFTVITSRGCPFDCSFCVSSKLLGRKVRRRSVRNVIDEIELLVRRMGAKEIHFADDCFTSDRTWVLEFCETLRTAGLGVAISFMNGLRADQVDEEILVSLKEAGVRTLGFGVETGDEELMARSGKRLSLSAVGRAFKASRRLGFNTWGFFILGFPEETREQALCTLGLSLKLDPDFAKFFPLVPYPGSRVFEEMQKRGMLDGVEWTDYSLYSKSVPTLSKMDSREIACLVSHSYRKFYLRPGKLASRLFRVRSRHELWLSLRMLVFLVDRFTSV